MRTVIVLVLISSALAFAQATNPNAANSSEQRVFHLDMGSASTSPQSSAKRVTTESSADELHADVLRLIELSSVRAEIEARKKPVLELARQKMMERCRQCRPEFADEWAKRMGEQLKTDEFIQVYASAYEHYLTRGDVAELIELKLKAKAHQPATATPRLRAKLREQMPSIMGEIMGGCTKLGAETGGRVAEQIQQEHPEYLK